MDTASLGTWPQLGRALAGTKAQHFQLEPTVQNAPVGEGYLGPFPETGTGAEWCRNDTRVFGSAAVREQRVHLPPRLMKHSTVTLLPNTQER